jgi:PIN domain nuclease of toxin-antitoxin system
MKYLLDTHTFLWLLNAPELIPDRVLNIVKDPSATVLVSLVVPWEIAIKAKTGKLETGGILDDFETQVTRAKYEILPTTVRQVIRGGSLPLHHRDPFDRLLIAQSFELSCPILSNEPLFDLYSAVRIWD